MPPKETFLKYNPFLGDNPTFQSSSLLQKFIKSSHNKDYIRSKLLTLFQVKYNYLILRKETAREMWMIIEYMYGTKKTDVWVYQLMKNIYLLPQGEKSVSDFYCTLKSKWEDLDYYTDEKWKCHEDRVIY